MMYSTGRYNVDGLGSLRVERNVRLCGSSTTAYRKEVPQESNYFLDDKKKILERLWKKFDNCIDFLFPGQLVTADARRALYSHMVDNMYECKCCVMYSINKECRELCESFGLDMGRRETVINNFLHVSMIEDYRKPTPAFTIE